MFREVLHIVVFSFATVVFMISLKDEVKNLTRQSPVKEKLTFIAHLISVAILLFAAIEAIMLICH